jgi:hypothetical protein
MNNAMHDLQRSQEIIMSHSGVHQWRDKTRKSQYFYNQWESKVRGGVRKIMDIHGNDASYRSAKKRLYNLAIELGEWSVLERAWELEKESEPEVFAAEPEVFAAEPGLLTAEMEKMERMEFSATNAVALYNGALQQGVFRKVDDGCERYTQKRGREWEVSASAEYPESEGEEDRPTRHRWFKTNAAQRKFIDASEVRALERDGDVHVSQPKRKRRRTDANVRFNDEVYVRGWKRWSRYRGPMYEKGAWVVKNGSEYVDTTGNLYPEHAYDDWKKQVAYILEEGDKMDLDCKDPNGADEETASKVEEEADRFMDADEVGKEAGEAAEKECPAKPNEDEAEDGFVVEHEQSREDEVVGAENAVNKEEHEAADTVASTEPATATVKVEGLVRALISFPMAWR